MPLIQGGPSGRRYNFVDIKLRVPPQHCILISLLLVNKIVVHDQMDHPVGKLYYFFLLFVIFQFNFDIDP